MDGLGGSCFISAAMLGFVNRGASQRDALRRIKGWTRARFDLGDDAAVLVTEIACGLPGCPPLETVIAFWTEGDRRHHFKVFKPAAEVAESDLPPSWMKNALAADETLDCDCC